MKKHPIFNSSCTHYDNESEPTILQIQKELTLDELIGFCKGNVIKYKKRYGKKEGENLENNIDKQTTYRYGALFYRLFKIFKAHSEEHEILIKIWNANITEKEARDYLAKNKAAAENKKMCYVIVCDILEYLLRS